MIKREKQIVEHVIIHYKEVLENMQLINSFEDFMNPVNKNIQKAIKMDVAQIGENLIHLSEEAESQINAKDLKGIVDIRNHIVHGYLKVDNEIIYDSITNDLPGLIEQIKNLK